MLAIFTGVRREHDAIERNLTVLERIETDDGYFISVGEHAGKPVLVCRTNMGEERAKGIVDQVLHQYPVSAVVSARIAPALRRNLGVGTLTICQSVFLRRKPGVITEATGKGDLRLMEIAGHAAKGAGLQYMVGECVTLSPLEPHGIRSQGFGSEPPADVADSEGFWVAETSFEHNLPFLAVRSSLGYALNSLPQGVQMVGPKAYVPAYRFIGQAIRHPGSAADLLRLRSAVYGACNSLSSFFSVFLRELAEQPMPTPDRNR